MIESITLKPKNVRSKRVVKIQRKDLRYEEKSQGSGP